MADHIQIGDISPRIQYAGDGVQTAFTYPFPVFTDADIEVYEDSDLQTIITHFTVAGAGDSAGGMVNFVTAPASGVVVTLRRNIAIERTSDFQESGEFRAKVINDELDKLTATAQQIETEVDRALHLGPTDSATSNIIPDKAVRLGKVLAFDPATGDPVVSNQSLATMEAGSVAAAASAAAALVSETAAASSETNAANSASTASISATSAGTSETNAASSAAAASTSATNAGTSETNAASSASAASTSQTNAGTSETNAANSASTASTSATNAGTSETNAASSASAASTSATNAGTSETNAASSASAASTSQTNAGTSETNAASSAAAASTSETNADTSETNAASSASAASISQTNAGTSETNASGSASAASTSETNASASATAAAASAAMGLYKETQVKSAPYTVVVGDEGDLIKVDASGGAVTITLDALATIGVDFRCAVAKSDASANAVTVQRSSSDTINGAPSITLTDPYELWDFVGDTSAGLWLGINGTASGITGGNGIDKTGGVLSLDLDTTPGLEFNSGKVRTKVDGSSIERVSEGIQVKGLGISSGKLANDAVTLAKMAHGTDGNLISYDASGAPAAVSTGSAGQVLTSNGAGTAPSMQEAGGGASAFLGKGSVSSVSAIELLDGVGGIVWDDTYDVYWLVVDNLITSGAVDFVAQLHDETGAAYLTANYGYRGTNGSTFYNDYSTSRWVICGDPTGAGRRGGSMSLQILGCRTADDTQCFGNYSRRGGSATEAAVINGAGILENNKVIDGIKIYPASGSFSGNWYLYGFKGA